MDQNLVNFWKNYEDIINWGYMISGARETDVDELTVSKNIQSREISNVTSCTNLIDEEYNEQYDVEDCFSDISSNDIDLEYLKFSKKTLEHQEKVEKEKRKVDREYGLCNSLSSDNESNEVLATEEINPKELYGSKVDEIELLENKLQSVFESFCVVKKPILWPGLALNLSVIEPELHLDLKKSNHPFLG